MMIAENKLLHLNCILIRICSKWTGFWRQMPFNECHDCAEGWVQWEHSSLANVMSVYTSFLRRGNKHHSDHWSSSEMQLSAAAHCYLWSPLLLWWCNLEIAGYEGGNMLISWWLVNSIITSKPDQPVHTLVWPQGHLSSSTLAVINHIQISSTFQSQKPDKINWLYHNITVHRFASLQQELVLSNLSVGGGWKCFQEINRNW